MADAADITAVLVAAINLLAAAGGGWALWRGAAPRPVWIALRVGQISTTALAAVALVALVDGYDAPTLFWVYLLLPIAVSTIAEQLRLSAAQLVLDQRGLEDAQAVGRLPVGEQQGVVAAIVRRELLVLTLAAVVITILALRVLATT